MRGGHVFFCFETFLLHFYSSVWGIIEKKKKHSGFSTFKPSNVKVLAVIVRKNQSAKARGCSWSGKSKKNQGGQCETGDTVKSPDR